MRWLEILELQPPFVEIITWNDYGESHYIGPLSSPHTDDGSSKWVNDMYVKKFVMVHFNTSLSLISQAPQWLARHGKTLHFSV